MQVSIWGRRKMECRTRKWFFINRWHLDPCFSRCLLIIKAVQIHKRNQTMAMQGLQGAFFFFCWSWHGLASTSPSSPIDCAVALGHAFKTAGHADAELSVAGTDMSSSCMCHTAPAHQRLSSYEGPPKPGLPVFASSWTCNASSSPLQYHLPIYCGCAARVWTPAVAEYLTI